MKMDVKESELFGANQFVKTFCLKRFVKHFKADGLKLEGGQSREMLRRLMGEVMLLLWASIYKRITILLFCFTILLSSVFLLIFYR